MSDWAHLTSLTTCQGLVTKGACMPVIFRDFCLQPNWLSQFFCSEISPNFNLKNMISTFTKAFAWKKNGPNSLDFEGIFFQIAIFSAISSNKQPRMQKDSVFFFFSYFHIQLVAKSGKNRLMDDCHFSYIKKLEK